MSKTKKYYFDYVATTPVKKEVADEMYRYYTECFGNPSSAHSFGSENKLNLSRARDIIASCFKSKSNEVYFTSGGTEADNLAIKGVAESYKDKGKHIITSQIEHKAILNSCKHLEKNGYDITYLPVDSSGKINLSDLNKAIRKDTILVSVMYINNEMGAIQDIKGIARICKNNDANNKVIFHTDAVQAFSHFNTDVDDLGVDMMSISAHKFYGPKGIGALYVKKGVKFTPLIDGGSQEIGKRAGTENVAGIMGMAFAASMAKENYDKNRDRLIKLSKYVIEGLSPSKINSDYLSGHPGILNITFSAMSASQLIIKLNSEGIAVSGGSACSSGSISPSHVLSAIGLSDEQALSSIRISFGDFTSTDDCDHLIKVLNRIFS